MEVRSPTRRSESWEARGRQNLLALPCLTETQAQKCHAEEYGGSLIGSINVEASWHCDGGYVKNAVQMLGMRIQVTFTHQLVPLPSWKSNQELPWNIVFRR